jgi:hypothetical protein
MPCKGLNPFEMAMLRAVNTPQATIDSLASARRSRGVRLVSWGRGIPSLIMTHAEEMMESAGGKFLFSARSVGLWLIRRQLHPEVNFYTGFGLALGGQGLELVSIVVDTADGYRTRYYDLRTVGMTAEQKVVHLEGLNSCGLDVIMSLIAS